MLTGKKVILGISGSISAYKMANTASMLQKLNCDVQVILTEHAAKFITPLTFETLTKNPCLTDEFERCNPPRIHHIEMGQNADLILLAPASADILGKLAHGIADDLLTSTVIAATCPVILAPAMNVHMYQNPIVQENIRSLQRFGYTVLEPAVGHLACGTEAIGKLPEESKLVDAVVQQLFNRKESQWEETKTDGLAETIRFQQKETANTKQDLAGRKILVTAGPTRESLDPVRFITNHSSGKMGYAIAEEAAKRGAEVTLISGPVQLQAAEGVSVIPVITAAEMYTAVMRCADMQDIIIKAAAVADYRPKEVNTEKTKKADADLTIVLERTQDILAELGKKKTKTQCICGFSMETENVLENARKKLKKKNADMIAANSIKESGAGFGGNTNHLTLITQSKEEDLGMCPKRECANVLLSRLDAIWKSKQ